ncbi:MAG: formimidoylglutamase [Paludibacterium sp.]|uniref:formimidoylglutamase n=1 Tax=Paludibacterium sp. TaxID=1917523 RepID=UPI0025D10F90|nr:formimidoylglutamase [Paludibacterium sp.]MBV8045662.1 formimidoylglutamase [Paludibacterium sp.]MBV8648515.1 formimidoylglutamase [Paludibacterium sp.]
MTTNPKLECSEFNVDYWHGRCDDEEAGFTHRWHQQIGPVEAGRAGTTLLGFACHAGVVRNHGRAGAEIGPRALRRALSNVPLSGPADVFDAGDVFCSGDRLEEAQAAFAHSVSRLLADGHRVIGMGGGHEIALASFNGLLDARQAAGEAQPKIGIINFDAHFDLRAGPRGTSGTPFRQISERCARDGVAFNYLCMGISRFANTAALFDKARALGARWREDERLTQADLNDAKSELAAFIAEVDHVYMTICLDVLPPSLAPGVSAPSARGVEQAVIEPLVDAVAASGKLRLFDLAELNPELDQDMRTARVAARLVARVTEAWGRDER